MRAYSMEDGGDIGGNSQTAVAAVPQKSITPGAAPSGTSTVVSSAVIPAAQKPKPTQQQIAHATLLRSLGYTPNKSPAAATQKKMGYSFDEYVKAAGNEDAFRYAPEALAKTVGYTGNVRVDTGMQFSHEGESGPVYQSSWGLDPTFKAELNKYQFAPTTESEKKNPALAIYNSGGSVLSPAFRAGDHTGSMMKFMGTVMPMLVGAGFGGALGPLLGATAGSATSGAITGATSGGFSTAVHGGSLEDVLKSALVGGVGGGMTNGLTNMGVNPTISKALTTLTKGAITGQDPRAALLSSIVGGGTGSPLAGSLLQYLLAQKPKKV